MSEPPRAVREHDQQLAAYSWLTVQALSARWGVSDKSVRKIPRDRLPYLTFGDSRMRRYKPEDVTRYEESEKKGEAA